MTASTHTTAEVVIRADISGAIAAVDAARAALCRFASAPEDTPVGCIPNEVARPVTLDIDYTTGKAASVDELRAAKNAAYAERDRLVAALSKCFPSHLNRHVGEDWEDDWRNIVCVHLPAGSATWHIHDSEMPWFEHLGWDNNCQWDGHTTEAKYERLAALGRSWARGTL